MNAITIGKPNLYVKGMVKNIYRDRATGNIVTVDTVASEFAFQSEMNNGLIEGGFTNPVLKVIPDSVRLTGTYTSQAFSLETRQLISGGDLSYNGVVSVCETIAASGTKLTVTNTPAKSYGQKAADTLGWCYVKETGATEYQGTNYSVDLTTKEIVDFTAVNGNSYDVMYFTTMASAKVLTINDVFNPADLSLEQVFGVFSDNNGNSTYGSMYGYLHVFIPRIQLTGNVGVGGSQTENSTTDGAWQALSDPQATDVLCDDCGSAGNPYAYYVLVPCAGTQANVEALAVPGGMMTIAVGQTKQIPVVYIMDNGEIVQPKYGELNYDSGSTATASVNTSGQVTGVAQGSTEIEITTDSGKSCFVTVEVESA